MPHVQQAVLNPTGRDLRAVQGVLKVLSVAAECTLPPFVLFLTLGGVLAIL